MKKRQLIWLVAIAGFAVCAGAAGLKIELPRETQTFKPGPGYGLANARCLACHSADYIVIQPPMPKAAWKNSVTKMQQKYGAEIPENEVEQLADYLARTYGNEKPDGQPMVTPVIVSEPNADGARLTAKFACVACHSKDRKIVGPAFKDIAAKYKGAPDAQAKLTRQISFGGGGNWGPVPMPPFPQISSGDVKTIIDWILAQQP